MRQIALELGRAHTRISREIARNSCNDGWYRPSKAASRTRGRRLRSRRNARITLEQWAVVERYLQMDWSPEQVSGFLRAEGLMRISHEAFYIHIWHDKAHGGDLWRHLRQATKKYRKRYRSYDSRGRLAGKRHISERPAAVEAREELGHWEIDTLMGTDKGTEFHNYKDVEAATGVEFYFATPHHSWERGTNENTNGLIRQYLPKKTSQAHITQADCDWVAAKLNSRPRKRLGYKTPEECYAATR